MSEQNPDAAPAIDYEQLWAISPAPSAVLDGDLRFLAANPAAEQLFDASARSLRRRRLSEICGESSRIASLVAEAARRRQSLTEYGVEIARADDAAITADLRAVRLGEAADVVLLVIHPHSNAAAMGRSLGGQGAARSLTALSAMLAHELKNPLAGISGAAQLLEMTLGDAEAEMLSLIHAEVDRIRALVERVDAFGDSGPLRREPVNLHAVLDQARRSAEAGFGRHIRFRETYDPSLPPTPGEADRLLQAFSNLIKNAAEAAPTQGGEVILRTAYRPGLNISVAGGGREKLPLEVAVIDNGPGVPEALAPHIFDPFVTSKAAGTGLGLAVVAKAIHDHGGVIDYRRRGGRTVFRMLLPVWSDPLEAPASEVTS